MEEVFIARQVTHLLSCLVCWVFYHTNRCLPQSWKLSERGVNSYLNILAHNGELILLLVHLELLHFRLDACPGTHGTVPEQDTGLNLVRVIVRVDYFQGLFTLEGSMGPTAGRCPRPSWPLNLPDSEMVTNSARPPTFWQASPSTPPLPKSRPSPAPVLPGQQCSVGQAPYCRPVQCWPPTAPSMKPPLQWGRLACYTGRH